MAGKKNLVSRVVVRHLRVPRYQEFTTTAVYKIASTDELLMSYLPDLDMARRPPNREFVFHIFATVCTHKFDYVMAAALQKRNILNKNQKDPSSLNISTEAAEVLLSDFYVPRKYIINIFILYNYICIQVTEAEESPAPQLTSS